jgi:hypothetical protein
MAVFMTADQHQKLMENPVKILSGFPLITSIIIPESARRTSGTTNSRGKYPEIDQPVRFHSGNPKKMCGFSQNRRRNTKNTVQKILIDLWDLLEEDCR